MDEYVVESRIRYSDTEVSGRLKPAALFNLFQDAAANHCLELGISGMDLRPHNLAWVVIRYTMVIHEYPKWNDPVRIRTRRHPEKDLYEIRLFQLETEDGELLAEAKSAWVLVKFDTMKPVRLKRNLPGDLCSLETIPIEFDLSMPPACENADHTARFTARLHDLDYNSHVNNAVYLKWATESVPLDIIESYRPVSANIAFTNETRLGKIIIAKTQICLSTPKPSFVHSLCLEDSGKEVARAKTIWAPR